MNIIIDMVRLIRYLNPGTRANWYTVFHARSGNILNLRDLEQGLEQLKWVPTQDADRQISPGENSG